MTSNKPEYVILLVDSYWEDTKKILDSISDMLSPYEVYGRNLSTFGYADEYLSVIPASDFAGAISMILKNQAYCMHIGYLDDGYLEAEVAEEIEQYASAYPIINITYEDIDSPMLSCGHEGDNNDC